MIIRYNGPISRNRLADWIRANPGKVLGITRQQWESRGYVPISSKGSPDGTPVRLMLDYSKKRYEVRVQIVGLDPTFVPPGAISERVILSAEHVGSSDSA
jgi:hypothetical protein